MLRLILVHIYALTLAGAGSRRQSAIGKQRTILVFQGKLMTSKLSIRALGEDDGLLTIDSHAVSYSFSGKTQVYTTCEALEKWAGALKELPLEAGQTVAFHAGDRDSYAYLGITISVLDSVGHCVCKVEFESNSTHTWDRKNKLEVEMGIEPNAVDQFALELMAIVHTHQGEACLSGVDSE